MITDIFSFVIVALATANARISALEAKVHWFTGPTGGSAGSIVTKNHQI
jgi:hypothetical protein